MEVVVPDRELSGRAGPDGADGPGDARAAYVLQVGSFRQAADAEAMKARLALVGIQASVQIVTVNAETWHRVRVGPVQGARRADELRRQLLEQDYPALVLEDSS
jgi:cell division protein FtsN